MGVIKKRFPTLSQELDQQSQESIDKTGLKLKEVNILEFRLSRVLLTNSHNFLKAEDVMNKVRPQDV